MMPKCFIVNESKGELDKCKALLTLGALCERYGIVADSIDRELIEGVSYWVLKLERNEIFSLKCFYGDLLKSEKEISDIKKAADKKRLELERAKKLVEEERRRQSSERQEEEWKEYMELVENMCRRKWIAQISTKDKKTDWRSITRWAKF